MLHRQKAGDESDGRRTSHVFPPFSEETEGLTGKGESNLWRRAGLSSRVLAAWGAQARLDFLFMTRDLKSFLLYVITDTILTVASVTGTLLLAAKFNGIGAWGRNQILFLLGYAMLVSGVVAMLFGYNVLAISRRIGRGQFDHTLVQPRPLWVALLTEGFVPFSGGSMLLPGIGLLAWAWSQLNLGARPGWLALLALNYVASCVVVVALSFLWGSLAFWSPRAAEEICSPVDAIVQELKGFPLDTVSPALAGGLLFLFPVGFVAWFPCRALLGLDTRPAAILGAPFAALILAALATALFRKGYCHYVCTGSRRYLSHGHRR